MLAGPVLREHAKKYVVTTIDDFSKVAIKSMTFTEGVGVSRS